MLPRIEVIYHPAGVLWWRQGFWPRCRVFPRATVGAKLTTGGAQYGTYVVLPLLHSKRLVAHTTGTLCWLLAQACLEENLTKYRLKDGTRDDDIA